MTAKKSVLIICSSNLSIAPRVIRQLMALKDEYKVYTLGTKPSTFADVEHFTMDISVEKPKHWNYPWLVRKAYSAALNVYGGCKRFYINHYFENDYWTPKRKQIVKEFKGKHFDIIIAHHWDALPIAASIATKGETKLVFNAHDYYTREFENNPSWAAYSQKQVTYLMKKYLPKFDLIFAAWTKLKDDFSREYGVPSIIINNATEYNELTPHLKNEDGVIKIIHHGIANSDRKIEKMIEVMNYLDDRFRLDLMLMYSHHEKEYYQMLKSMASKDKRIQFIDPVPTREISKKINEYDIGLFLLPPNGINPTYTLPNKSFDFVQGRVASLVTPNIEMKKLVDDYDLGWVSDDFEPASIAAKIKNVTHEEINQKKLNAHTHAYELSAETTYFKIRKAINELVNPITESTSTINYKNPELV